MEHKKQISYYAAIALEMIVSGYYNEMNLFWWVTRLGILAVIYAAIETKKTIVLRFAPMIFVFLSLSGIREKWQSIAAEKIVKQETTLRTNVVKPDKPRLEDCNVQPKYARPECLANNRDLQLAYSKSLERYNSRIETSESNIRHIDVELSLYDQQPIWIYVLLSMACIVLTVLTTIEEKKVETLINQDIKEKDLRVQIVNRIAAGRSNLSIAEELGIDRRRIARIKKEIDLKLHNDSPTVVQFRKREKA